jgi:hypothetical protein
MKSTIGSGFLLWRALLCDHFRGNYLKRECHSGYQGKNCVDSRGVSKTLGSEEARDRNVVGKVDSSRKTGSRKQNNASGDNAGLQRFHLVDQTNHRILESRLALQK